MVTKSENRIAGNNGQPQSGEVGDDLVSLFKNADASQLDAIREKIDALQQEIDCLSVVAKALDLKLNGKPAKAARKSPARRSAPGGGKTVAQQIEEYLELRGSTRSGVIAADLGINAAQVSTALNKHTDRFQKDGDAWALAK